jgi:hypothetical protein
MDSVPGQGSLPGRMAASKGVSVNRKGRVRGVKCSVMPGCWR